MASVGRTVSWRATEWANYVLQHLSAESVLLRSGARRIDIAGTQARVPRLLDDGTVSWVAEGTEIPSDAPEADSLLLVPKKAANVVSLSNESIADASVSVLNSVGDALTRAIAKEVDARAFSTQARTATAPAGLLAGTLSGAAGNPDIAGILTAIGAIEANGGVANAVCLNPTDRTAIRQAVVAGGYSISDPTAPGAEAIGGARLYRCRASWPARRWSRRPRKSSSASPRRVGDVLAGRRLYVGLHTGARRRTRRLGVERHQRRVLHFVMAEQRWKATTAIVVAGKPVKAGETFTAPAEDVADAVARRLVVPAPANGRRREKS
jgi:Phage capsid family